ncbi:MAG TPA: hypothetical protein VFV02_01880 [Acidimicrobiales bacterium]|nr:hypothetical protein [Acidimicrobiales bacterium]
MTTNVAATRFESPDELLSAAGRNLGTTPWMTVDSRSVEQFCQATGPAGPESEQVSPFMILSLTNYFLPQLLEVRGISSGVNYGTGPVRFGVTPRGGDRLRATATIVDAADVPGGVQTTIRIAIEIEGEPGPACVVESLSRWLR